MKKVKSLVLSAVLLTTLLLTSLALASGSYSINWWVIAGGGGVAEAGTYSLDFTIGQPVVGVAKDTGYELCSGFWCSELVAVEYRIYLPIVLKNYS
jgi:hypothetical protein